LISLHRTLSASPPPAVPRPGEAQAAADRADTVIRFRDAEREAILRALMLSGWRISGPAGAADLLGLRPTTLHAKMKKLGIRRPSVTFCDEEAPLRA
jgi:transcriptional regulator with GAF, ATPase, and Fis domain